MNFNHSQPKFNKENIVFIQKSLVGNRNKLEPTVYYTYKSDFTASRIAGSRAFLVYHLLTGKGEYMHPNEMYLIDWDSIPYSYRADAFSLNQEIRDLSGNKSGVKAAWLRGARITDSEGKEISVDIVNAQYISSPISFDPNKIKIHNV